VSVPKTLDEARSVEWLSAALGVEVDDVVPGPIDDRVSTNARVQLRFADGRARDVWIKGYFSESGAALRDAGVPEVHFYRELASATGVRTLHCLHAEVDPATGSNILVTEDVGDGAVFPDGCQPCSPDQTAQSLAELATLHLATWGDPRWAAVPWLAPRMERYTVRRGVAEIADNFESDRARGVPASARDPQRLFDSYRTLAELAAAADPWCVVHGDAHIRNVYLDPAGRPSLLDWQLVQRGPWYLDVGYHIATMLSVEDRRANEAALVAEYVDRLVVGGIERPGAREVERALCLGFVNGFYLWGITLRVEPAAIAALLERLGTAVDDHDAYRALER
jgi:hypothetical protein